MALQHSPSVVTNGLVMYYDMSNTKKSWKGAPATNLAFPSILNTDGLGSLRATVNSGRAPDGRYTATKYVWSTVGNNYIYVGGITSTAGASYVASMYVKENNSVASTMSIRVGSGDGAVSVACIFNTTTLAISSGGTSGVTGIATTVTNTGDGWYRISVTGTFPVSVGLLFGFTTDAVANGNVLVWGAQFETGSFATPYIPTTSAIASRSNTQAIIDLTGNNTITATSLTYAADNTFSFNGTTDSILTAITDAQLNAASWSVSSWVKFTSVGRGTDNMIFSHGAGVNNGGLHLTERSTRLYFGFYANDGVGTTVLVAGNWYNIVFVFDYSTKIKKAYINGVLDLQGGTVGYSGTGSCDLRSARLLRQAASS